MTGAEAAAIPVSTAPAAGLRRQLGLGSAAAAVAGEAIGVGIFLTPAAMAKSLGSPFWLLAVWLGMGAMTMSGALCYGELAGRFPRPGGSYVYLQETFGPRLAFLYGWMCLLVLDPGLTAALAAGTAGYAAYIFHWSPVAIKLAALSCIWALCLLNVFSTRLSAGFLRSITWLKFGVLALLTIWAIAFHRGEWSNFLPFVAQRAGSLPLIPALGGGMVAAFFSFGGWWDVSKIAGEVRDPGRTVPRALVLGVLAVTAAYVLISAVFVYLVPLNRVTSDDTFVAQAGEVLFGPAGGVVLAAIVIVCVLGSMAALIMSAPRVYFAMAQDGLFLPAVARISPRFGTPALAVAILGLVSSLLVVLGTFQQIIAYFVFAAVAFLGLTVAGMFFLRARREAPGLSLRAPGYPFTPIAFLAMVVLLLTLLMARSPREGLLGCAVVLVGVPVYSAFGRRRP
ncbi:MAG: amino acid permease [Candidatus Acidiferrales bacterium]